MFILISNMMVYRLSLSLHLTKYVLMLLRCFGLKSPTKVGEKKKENHGVISCAMNPKMVNSEHLCSKTVKIVNRLDCQSHGP